MYEMASEYLLDYAKDPKCNPWLVKVINVFFQKDAESHIHELAEDLLEIKEYVVTKEELKDIDVNNDSVVLKKLVHRSGVNALAENQKINFSPQVNIVYGLNGTGKSSYFRILNELLGGSNETPIRSNIYSEKTAAISVDLKYMYRGIEKTVSWDGSIRGLDDLRSMRVFDSAYTRDLLSKRNSDELVVKPYGLFLFADIVMFIDQITAEANEIVDQKEQACPRIDIKDIIDEIANIFSKETITEEDVIKLKEFFDLEENYDALIEKKDKEIQNLKVGNPKDKIVIQSGKKAEITKVIKYLEQINIKGNQYKNDIFQKIEKYQKLKKLSEEYRKNLEILNGIPGTDTDLWKEFIGSGIAYRNEHQIEECPFCHQKYSDSAKAIVDAYALFLDNKSQIELDDIIREIAVLKEEIISWNTSIEIDAEKWETELVKQIEQKINEVETYKTSLINAIDNKDMKVIKLVDNNKLCEDIESYKKLVEKAIEDLSVESDGKTKALELAETEMKKLKSINSIKSQQKEIDELVETKQWIKVKKKTISEISSQKSKISTLSKKAHNELLTDQLQSEFSSNLKALNIKNIEIQLEGKNNKGKQQTELTIKSNKDITSILSEGEQKATALALYLAEISLSKNKSTIIFDDPVNSLDHRMMQALADLLMNIDNQVIVFTHNKMFLDCFECTVYGHICKGIISACSKNDGGKHIYLYETQSEGQSRKGVIIEKRCQNLDFYLNEISKMLSEVPFTRFDEAAVKLRRGVETAIDEIIFNRQVPTKLSNKNSRIQWNELKKICNDENLINGLKQIHGRASGGDLHNGSEREENPLEREEIEELYEKLKTLCGK